MKKTILTIAVVIGGVNLLMAEALTDLKDNAGAAKPAVAAVASPSAENKAGGRFKGTATWSGKNGYEAVEQAGIRKSAEEDAVAKCQATGLPGCRAIGSTLTSPCADYRNYKCTAAAMAMSLVPVPGAAVFSAKAQWPEQSGGFSPLEQLGIRKTAEDRAVFECQSAGFLTCVAIASTMDYCGWNGCGATAMAQAQMRTIPE